MLPAGFDKVIMVYHTADATKTNNRDVAANLMRAARDLNSESTGYNWCPEMDSGPQQEQMVSEMGIKLEGGRGKRTRQAQLS